MSARKDIAAFLGQIVPKKWRIIDADQPIDELSVTCLVVSQRQIDPAPNAIGNHRVTLLVFVIDPRKGADASEDSLDDATETVLFAIDKAEESVIWTGAEKVSYQGHRAYQITVQAASQPKE